MFTSARKPPLAKLHNDEWPIEKNVVANVRNIGSYAPGGRVPNHYVNNIVVLFSTYVKRSGHKVKVWVVATAPLTWVRLVTSSALQSRKWQLIGNEPMGPQRIMWPSIWSIARTNGQLDRKMTFLAQGTADWTAKSWRDRQAFLKQNFESWH